MSQSMDALATANEKRMLNAELRARVRRREIPLAELFADPPASIENLLVLDVCRWAMWTRGQWDGVRRLNRAALVEADVNLMAPVGSLSPRQLGWLADRLGRVPLGRGPQRRKATA